MLKFISFLARRPGLSPAEFLHHWTEVHAPMWTSMPGLRGYVIGIPEHTHTRADVTGLEMAPFDGVATTWFDSLEARAAAAASAEGRAWHADGASIIGQIRSFVTEEEVAIPIATPRPGLRALSLVKRKPGADPADFQKHWRGIHGPMAREVPALRGFILSGILEEQFRADIPPLPMDGPIDGFAESWVEDMAARNRMVASPEAQRWFADGASFLGQVKTVLLRDQVLLAPP